jgi:hypothetical protein
MSATAVRSVGICSKRRRMEIHGSIENNLTAAVQSARRLSGHPVHTDTVDHWRDLLAYARQNLTKGSNEPIKTLIAELENELADRPA